MTDSANLFHSRNLILRLAGRNIHLPTAHFSDIRHTHHLWSIDFCDSGENIAEIENRRYAFREGDILLIAPEQEHRFIYTEKAFSCYSFKFELPHFSGFQKMQTIYAGHSEGLKKRLAIISAVKSCLQGFCPPEMLVKRFSFTICETYDGIHILEDLLYGIARHYICGDAKRSQEITSDSLLTKMSEYIYIHGGEPVSVEELAEHLEYSPGHLRTLVYQRTGMTTKRFIDMERIKIIKEMLRYSDARNKELADRMHFPDVKYFTRFFRKYTGQTPRCWLRSQLKHEEV